MGFAVEDGWWVCDGRRARIKDHGLEYAVDLDDGIQVGLVTVTLMAEAMETVTRFLQPKCTVRVETDGGNSWVTTINTDFAGAVKYFRNAGGFENANGDVCKVVSVQEVCDA